MLITAKSRNGQKGGPLKDYGILIPVAPNRPAQILEALRKDPEIGDREAEWYSEELVDPFTRADVERVNTPEYVEKIFGEGLEDVLVRVFELVDKNGKPNRYDPSIATRPLSELLQNSLRSAAGTHRCCEIALEQGFCFIFSGGGHHGHPDFGHGFCVLNDIGLALRKLQADKRIKTAWVIDVDAHKGDGTAAITEGDDSVITLSVHMANGWPLDRAEYRRDGTRHPSYVPSNIDVPIGEGEEHLYCSRLSRALHELDGYPKPDLVIVELGADPYEGDELASTRKLRLSLDQMLERDLMIYNFLSARSLPMAYLMAGGYGDRAWEPYPPFLSRVVKRRLGISSGD